MRWCLGLVALAGVVAGCGGERGGKADAGKIVLQMWHSQQKQNADALEGIVARFNEASPQYKVVLQNLGSYPALYQKACNSIRAKQLPDLCIAYESMVTEFMEADVVAPLDEYFESPECGFSREEQADFFPTFISSNRYPEFGNRLFSFPFHKSLLMLYYNCDLLRAAGHEKPPATWAEFIAQCRDVTAKSGHPAYAYVRDASSFDGMVFSLGGKLVSADGTKSLLDSPEVIRVFEMLRTLMRDGLAELAPIRTEHDRVRFATGRAAFILRSSTSRSYMREDIVDEQGRDRFEWSLACPPVGEGRPKLTVLYGGNICIFKTTPERQRGAWEFIKFFVSPEVTAEWSVKTGYLPVRRSAEKTKVLQDFFGEHPRNRITFDTIPYGVPEPNVAGWQNIRELIGQALTRVCKSDKTPAEAAAELAREADKELARHGKP
jgi:multiple sugar transport system substrate-binding protein